MFLPAEIIPVLAHFAPVFTAPTYQKALVLVVGTILAKGRRTVTSALRAVGHTQTADWAKYHHVLNRARWSGLQLSDRLLLLLVATWAPCRRYHGGRGRDAGTPLGPPDSQTWALARQSSLE